MKQTLVAAVLRLATDAASARQTAVYKMLKELSLERDPVMLRLRDLPLADPQLISMERDTQLQPAIPGQAKEMQRVALVEIHDDPRDGEAG